MKLRLFLVIGAMLVFFGAIFGWKAFVAYEGARSRARQAPPAVTVSATAALLQTWSPLAESVGTLRASKGVDVTAQVGGMITTIYFKSGADVSKSELLLQEFVADDQAKLRGLRAQASLAKITADRTAELTRRQLASRTELDTAQANFENSQAQVNSLEQTISEKSIRAPFAGVLGVRQVDVGQFINPGDRIVSLQDLETIFVDFSLPQQQLPKAQIGQRVTVTVDAYPGVDFAGAITAVDPVVDKATRNFLLRAELTNRDRRLRPGMFAGVRVTLPGADQFVTIPGAAINYGPSGDSVFVIQPAQGPDGTRSLTVRSAAVTTGESRGDQVAVLKGIRPGDQVVTSGQMKLKNGASVIVDNSVAPANEANPAGATEQ